MTFRTGNQEIGARVEPAQLQAGLAPRGWHVAAFAGFLAAAGLPLYIHLPIYAFDRLGVEPAALALVLLGVRALDFIQDPLFGRLADKHPQYWRQLANCAMIVMALGFAALFAFPAYFVLPMPPILWLSICVALLVSAFSLATILFYAGCTRVASQLGGNLHVAAWRETGGLGGVLLASLLPAVAAILVGGWDYAAFGVVLAGLGLALPFCLRAFWQTPEISSGEEGALAKSKKTSSMPIWQSYVPPQELRSFMLLAFVNMLPLGVTSTLFLLFVEYRLELPNMAGAFLLLFFASAALASPVWAKVAKSSGNKKTLAIGMVCAISSFVWAAFLGAGDGIEFALVCILSGAAVGADFIVIPATLSALVMRDETIRGRAFGQWSFCNKLAFALSALVLLVFETGAAGGTAQTLDPILLSVGYALVPCALKMIALALLLKLNLPKVTL